MSYITGSVSSQGDYARELDFTPDDDASRMAYRDALAALEGTRYLVVSRELRTDETRDDETGETELTVIVAPSPRYIADLLRFTAATREDRYHYGATMTRYYSEPSEFYVARNGVPVWQEDRYCVDVHGVSATRLAVIENAAR